VYLQQYQGVVWKNIFKTNISFPKGFLVKI